MVQQLSLETCCRKVYTIITETSLSLLQQLLDLALIRQIHIKADSLRDLWEIVVLHYKHSRVKISLVYKGASPPPPTITHNTAHKLKLFEY